jgi:hypothetical protein
MTEAAHCLPNSGNGRPRTGPRVKGAVHLAGNVAVLIPASRRELLCQALIEAMFHADPPQDCPACEAQDRLCDSCAAGWTRARAYLALARDLGIQNIYEVTPARG